MGIVMLVIIMLSIPAIVFLCLRPQADPQLAGIWRCPEADSAFMTLHANGTGSIEPYRNAVTWHTRNGYLLWTSMGIRRHYEYLVSEGEDGIKLTLISANHDGRSYSRTYVRINE